MQIHLLRTSFARIERQAPVAALEFYRRLFEACPHLRPLFSTEIEQQACKLMDMLSTAISLLERPGELRAVLGPLGARHVRYGVKESHYDDVADALFGMLRKVLAADYTPEVDAAWRELYAAIRDGMLGGARPASPPPPE